MPSSGLSRRNSYALLSVLLAVCFMNWLFGDQVSCHTLLLRAEVMYVNDHPLFDHR